MDPDFLEAAGREVTPPPRTIRSTPDSRLRIRPATTIEIGSSSDDAGPAEVEGDADDENDDISSVYPPLSAKKVNRSTSIKAARTSGVGRHSRVSKVNSDLSSSEPRSQFTPGIASTTANTFTNPQYFTPAPTLNSAPAFNSTPNFTRSTVPVLGEELPRNVQDLLQGYYQANNTTTVPNEIYCIQVPRVHETTQGKPAVYTCHLTNEVVELRGYKLPSMKKKQSERLLVAVGRAFTQPVVLARTKSHSNEFRIWRGAADDGSGSAVITRSVPNHGKKLENRKRKSSSADGPPAKKKNKKKDSKKDSKNEIATDEAANEDASSALAPELRPHSVKTEHRDSSSFQPSIGSSPSSPATPAEIDQSPVAMAPDMSALNSANLPQLPDNHFIPTAPAFNGDSIENQTFFHFMSSEARQVVRQRPMSKCNTVDKLFTHAHAANTIPPNKPAVLQATVESEHESSRPIRIVDEEDYADLLTAVANSACWMNGEQCHILISDVRPRPRNVETNAEQA
jgi:hypothetical protein